MLISPVHAASLRLVCNVEQPTHVADHNGEGCDVSGVAVNVAVKPITISVGPVTFTDTFDPPPPPADPEAVPLRWANNRVLDADTARMVKSKILSVIGTTQSKSGIH
jgi:hypothetical protein